MPTNGHKEHPILFSGPMMRAILEGRKTQTRRVVTRMCLTGQGKGYVDGCSPYGEPGDRLWVRETFAHLADLKTKDPGVYALQSRAFFRADHPTGLSHDDATDLTWRPSIFMPRNLSRVTLEIVNVRVERLQKISGFDARAEGYPERMSDAELMHNGGGKKCRQWFHDGWDTINGKRNKGAYAWASNPWVWVVEFKRLST